MSTRTIAQVIGSQGQSLVAHIVNSSGGWIARTQDEDFGIDLEAELAMPHVSGQLLKIQIKTSRKVKSTGTSIICRIPRKLALYADSCRIPVIFVRVDLERQQAWYFWLQEWLLERQRRGLRISDMPRTVTHEIPMVQTLSAGLHEQLRAIAQWRTKIQLSLTVNDAIRTAAAVYDHVVLNHLVGLLDRLGIVKETFPVNLVVEHAVSLGQDLWATPQGNDASFTLYAICRHFGQSFSADQVWRMVTRGDSISRTGLNALSILYTYAFEYTRGLGLVDLFAAHEDQRGAFYCHLRELHPKKEFLECIDEGYDLRFAGLAIDPSLKDDLIHKWPNRGDSVILDYLYLTGS